MSAADLTHTCAVCGAEESLDVVLVRIFPDEDVRLLVEELITKALPLGGLLLRYLRLHKPAKQRLRMSTVRKVLAELVPDVQRTSIERKGRVWMVSPDLWRAAFQTVFDAAEKGKLLLPLEGNGYLYGVLANMADRREAVAEEEREHARRHHREEPVARTLDELEGAGLSPGAIGERLGRSEPEDDPEAAEKAAAIRQQLREARAARIARQQEGDQP
ncbi:hypothetical protein [Variovorax sp. DAIF25]|uniref:hypothetical protein n=1 Tax=Variovorax sp. DAIF25 TaxID=3080983 RepID=UPI003D6B3464